MARGGKKAGGVSASDGFASPVNAASKKRKSEALLKDLLGTTDDGLADATPGVPPRGARPKAAAAAEAGADLEGSLLWVVKEHSDRARERARAQVQEELASTASLVESELKALSNTLAASDEEETAARRQQLAQLAAEAADARQVVDKALAAFKKLSADKLAVVQRVRSKIAALEAAEAARAGPNKAECDKALNKLNKTVSAAGKRISAIIDEAQSKNSLKSALQTLVKSMDG